MYTSILNQTARDSSLPLRDRLKAETKLDRIRKLKAGNSRLHRVPKAPAQGADFSIKEVRALIGGDHATTESLLKSIMSACRNFQFSDKTLHLALCMNLRDGALDSYTKLREDFGARGAFKRMTERYIQKPTVFSSSVKQNRVRWERSKETIWDALRRYSEASDDVHALLPARDRKAVIAEHKKMFVLKNAGAFEQKLLYESLKREQEGQNWTYVDFASYLEELTAMEKPESAVLTASMHTATASQQHRPDSKSAFRSRTPSPLKRSVDGQVQGQPTLARPNQFPPVSNSETPRPGRPGDHPHPPERHMYARRVLTKLRRVDWIVTSKLLSE